MTGAAAAASTTTTGESQQHRDTAATTADPTSGRASDGARGHGGREPQQRPQSFSLGAIPTDQLAQHRDKKRSSARASLPAGYPDAAHRSDEAAYGHSPQPLQQTPDSLPRPYPLQSKSFGYAPKNLARSMGSTALPRDDSSGGFAMECAMAKGDPGRAVRIDHNRAPVPHGMSRSLPKQSYFPVDEGERTYYPSRSALCLHDLPHKQQYHHYYSPQVIRKADPGGRVSSSSSFKPKRHDDRREQCYYDPYSGLMAPPNYGEADYRKQWAAYTGDQRWTYDNRYQGHHHQYAVHMVQESGRNEVFREAGDNAVIKSSGDSGGELSKYASQQQSANDPSSMYVYVRDAQTSTDTPVPVDADESPPPSKAAEMPLLGEDAARQNEEESDSTSSSGEEEEDEDTGSESSSGSATPVNKPGDAAATLFPPEAVQQQMMAQHIQLQHQQALQMTQQEYAEYQDVLRSYEYYQQNQQQLHPLHPMYQQAMQQQMMIQQQLKQLQLQHQQQLQQQKQYQQQLQQHQLQNQQQQQQEPMNPGTGQYDKKRAFPGGGADGAGEMAVRMPGEGASIRSFQSRTSGAESGGVEASGEDNRSLLSSNMGTPLLRPLLPERATRTASKDKMEHLCLAVNVILFSVLAGVVAAFIVQQVTHAV
ncbi:hypothetical protein V5799_021596 [Amblyomma americanum]|uniref:Uncharacterized protein n=1 Tax=Amblyomma americanum TaxID=6943 RepID=A0AAQ4FNG9_AMBAM